MDNNLIIVKQLPIIEQQLMAVKEEIRARVEDALSLECTADTVKEIKKVRAELNKEHTEFESRRKGVKKAIMAPYEEFEALYKECISDQYNDADTQIKHRVAEVEAVVLKTKYDEVKAYFDEYAQSIELSWVSLEIAVPKITLSASVKSLKASAKAFLDRTNNDIKLINSMPYATEIMVEYKDCYDITQATQTVLDRHEKMEIEENLSVLVEQTDEQTVAEAIPEEVTLEIAEKVIEDITPLTAPTEVESVCSTSFRVTGTIKQLKALKGYMTEQGLKFESITGGTV